MPVDPIERLRANVRRRSEQTLQRAQDPLAAMAARGDTVTVASLAKNANVSRLWIRRRIARKFTARTLTTVLGRLPVGPLAEGRPFASPPRWVRDALRG
jgi:hypothetical protein